jgi:hypothetical protein
LEWFEKHIVEVEEEIQSADHPLDETKIARWNTYLLERQNLMRLFSSLYPEQVEEILPQYLRVCAYFIYFYEILSQYRNKEATYTQVQQEWKNLQRQVKLLQKK